jgi:hypothetical protein
MTVAELIAALQGQDPDAQVHFVYDYGDHWHTSVAPQVASVETGAVKHSEYHRMPKVLDLDAVDNEDQGAAVVLLQSEG